MSWKEVELREVIHLDMEKISIDPSKSYEMVGVYSFGKGLFTREPVQGCNTSYKHFYQLKKNHFVMSQLFGWEGALAISSEEFEGKFVSPQFPTFLCDENLIDLNYLGWLTRRPVFWQELGTKTKGMGDRRRTLNPEALFQIKIPLPPLSEQRRIVAKIEQLAAKIKEAQKLRQQVMDEVDNLVESRFHQMLEKDNNHVRILPFTGLAKLERRPIDLNPEEEYREVGIYCFGRGIFHKPPRGGFEIGAKKLYWIKNKDLILQVTFAWEGAVGLAGPQEDGMCGSVRFPTFVVNEEICDPRYLLMYLKTDEGIAQLGRISPGSAGRNRVLSLKRLDEILVPILPLSLQQSLMDDVGAKTAQIRRMQAQTAAELDALLPSILDKTFKGEL